MKMAFARTIDRKVLESLQKSIRTKGMKYVKTTFREAEEGALSEEEGQLIEDIGGHGNKDEGVLNIRNAPHYNK